LSDSFQRDLLSWWRQAEPFVEEHLPGSVGQLRNEAARLEKVLDANPSFVVCVLGQSAVGKSTLLNAIVKASETILPAGGVGPLTALATLVHYSDEPHFRVTYRDRRQLDGFRLQLERELARQARQAEVEPDASSEGEDSDGPDRNALEDLRRQVIQLIAGDQFSNLPLAEVVGGLRYVLGYNTEWVPSDRATADRVDTARGLVASADPDVPRKVTAAVDAEFTRLLREHAAGYLAPLVEKMEVGYPFEGLDHHIKLVDLPGIGVANDRYRAVTGEYVRTQASAVVLVVDRAGPTQTTVELLRDSGYWDRLLLSSSDPENDPVSLLMVVTRVDDVAREERRAMPAPKPSLHDVFVDVRARTQTAMRVQAANCFSTLGNQSGKDDDVGAARRDARDTLLERLEVYPVSAHEYRLMASSADDDEERPFVRDLDASGIPSLIARLNTLAAIYTDQRRMQTNAIVERFTESAVAVLEQIVSRWTAAPQLSADVLQLRNDLDAFIEPRTIEVAARGGAFREYLESTFSDQIARLVLEARVSAQEEVEAYLEDLRHCNWSTLRATVVRGGAFVSGTGRRVDLAGDIAQRFQEPMAAVWSRKLLQNIRKRTRSYGQALEAIVEEVCVWADSRANTDVQKQTLTRQRKLMSTRVSVLSEVGNDAVDELKDAIKRELMKSIEPAIRKKCVDFRDRGDAAGRGVKQRILLLFKELAAESVIAAANPAERLLQTRFGEVRSDINAALDEWGDPLQEVADAIVEREELRRMRSDAQRRRNVLEREQQLRSSMPEVSHVA
jgi:GTP-binding protein EngB required for normal cell division